MSSDKRPEKVPCHKCGKLCFRLCHNIGYKPGDRLVCLDCFKAACEKTYPSATGSEK